MIRGMLAGCAAVALVLAAAGAGWAADKDDVLAAAKKLGEAPNYTFTTTQTGGRGNQAPVDTKVEKDGYVTFAVSAMGGDTFDVVIKGEAMAAKGADGAWKTKAELQKASEDAGGFSPEMMVLMRVGSFATPSDQVKTLVEKAANVKKGDAVAATATQKAATVYTADLAEASAKDLLTFKAPAGSNFPEMTVKNAKGTLKVWVTDGMVTKTEIHLTGTTTFNEQDRDTDRTTTNEVKDVGTTKVVVPEEAKKKLEVKATTTRAAVPGGAGATDQMLREMK